MGRTRVARAIIEELKKRIGTAEKEKRELIEYFYKIHKKYLKQEISHSDYIEIVYKKRDGRNLYEWIDHFKAYIKDCENRIKEQKKNIARNRLPIIFFSFIFILILLASAFYIRPTFVGFLIQGEIPEAISEANVTIITTQQQAILGQPVKWTKTISLDKPAITKIRLPIEATNISVNKIIEFEEGKLKPEETVGVLGESYSEEINKEETLLKQEDSSPSQEEGSLPSETKFRITGAVISEETQAPLILKFLRRIGKITGQVVQEPLQEIEINDTATEYEIEYETPAPYAVEEPLTTGKGKRVKIIGPETIHYENVLSFTDLDENLNIRNPSSVKIYWRENNSFIPIQKIEDKNSNGIYDYIEWITPLLSEQTFDIIVEGDYQIIGDSVIVNDSFVYLNVTPHTITNNGWITVNLTSKKFTGDIDIVFGFDTSESYPKKALYYNPRNITTQKSYTCDFAEQNFVDSEGSINNISASWFNYTLSPNYFWCWRNMTITDVNGTLITDGTKLIFDHSFDTADLPSKTAFWNETKLLIWQDVSNKFSSVNIDRLGFNKWWYIKDFFVEAGSSYKLKVKINAPPKFSNGNGKYSFGIKRSADTIQEAISGNRFYYIDPWWNTTYDKRINITFGNSASSENFTDFPVLVVLNSTRINYSDTLDNGEDIRFVDDDDSTVLNHEIELWNESGDSFIWVKVPILENTSTDFIYMYYNNQSPVVDGQDITGVWNSNYKGVWHLGEEQSGSSNSAIYKDSTLNDNDGDDNVSATGQSGKIGDGQQFDGSDDYIHVHESSSLDITETITVEAWANSTNTGLAFQQIASKGSSTPTSDRAYFLRVRDDDGQFAIVQGGSAVGAYDNINLLSDNNWYYIVGVYDGSNVRLYVDGVEIVSNPTTGNIDSEPDGPLEFGNLAVGDGENFLGHMDEIRVSNISRSPDWINASYLSQLDQFNTYGAEESTVTTPTNIQCNGADNCNISVDTSVDLNASGSTDADGDAITYFIEASLQNITEVQNTTDVSKTGSGGGGGGPISFVRAAGTIGTSFTMDIGTAGTDRLVVVIAGDESETVNLTDVTVDGNSCTVVKQITNTVGIGNHQEMWYCDEDNLGASAGTVTIAIVGGDSEWAVHAQLHTGVNQSGPIDIEFENTAASVTTIEVELVTVPADGLVVMGAGHGSTGTQTSVTSPLVERTDGPNPSSAVLATSSGIETSAQTDKTYISTMSVSFNRGTGIVAVWAEATLEVSNETNTTSTNYTDVNSDFKSINNITIKVEVDSYDPRASVDQSTNDPDLYLEIWNSTDWVGIGEFDLNVSYAGDGLNTTNANFSLTTTDATILIAWQTSSNQDLSIKGIFMDHNGTLPDEINYTNVFVTIDGKSWTEIGNHTESTNLTWNTTDLLEQTGIDLRARAIDLTGINTFSSYFTKNAFLNISHVTNQAPTITNVEAIADTDPTEDSVVFITFNFTATDTDGASDINVSSAQGRFQLSGETTRLNTSCLNWSSQGNDVNFTCTIGMYYFDKNDPSWTINVTIKDNSDASGENSSTIFQYNQLIAIKISPNSFSFDVEIGAVNQTSGNDPTLINNTGNYDVTLGNVEVNAIDLAGEDVSTDFIFAANFSVGNATGSNTECIATSLVNGTYTGITNSILPPGNHSLNYQNETSGQEQLYYCIKDVPSDISSQTYSTSTLGSWTIRILLVAIIPAGRRKKKQKIIGDLSIPATIFSRELGSLEAISKYMKENLKMNYNEIAELLNRDQRTIWTSYKKATEKQKEPMEIEKTLVFLPVSILKNRKLTILESVTVYLKEQGMRYSEIAELLNRDQRNIWTIYSKAVKKLKKEEIRYLIKVQAEPSIPATIFSRELGSLEAISKYMKENLKMNYNEIAELLNRDQRTIWTSYKKATEKQKEPMEIEKTLVFLPTSIFKDRKLTTLESIVVYLKEQGLKYSEIAKLLDRDQRNIWAIYSRTVRKKKRNI